MTNLQQLKNTLYPEPHNW